MNGGFGGGFLENDGGYGGNGGNNGYSGGGGGYGNNYGNSASKYQGGNGTPMKDANDKKKGSIVPLTIKMLIEASDRQDDKVEVDNKPIDHAVIIGRVYKVETQQTRTVFYMDDSTGRIQVAYYMKADSHGQPDLDFVHKENMYVKAVVVVRPFRQQKSFIATSLQHVTDYNQISYHLLSIFLASAYRKKGPLPKPDPNITSNQGNANQGGTQQGGFQQQGGYQAMSGNKGQASSVAPQNLNSRDPKTMITNQIKHITEVVATGICKKSELVRALGGKIDNRTLESTLVQLQNLAVIGTDGDEDDIGFVMI